MHGEAREVNMEEAEVQMQLMRNLFHQEGISFRIYLTWMRLPYFIELFQIEHTFLREIILGNLEREQK